MYKFQTLGVSWPPQGWKLLKDIKNYSGQSISKDPMTARVSGLSYNIEPISLRCENDKSMAAYDVRIDGWEYTIHNESREYSVLSFTLHERLVDDLPKLKSIFDVRVKSCSIRMTERSVHYSLMAALLFMKQIDSGVVSNVDRILKFYKIHPLQRNLYQQKETRNCFKQSGLPNSYFENGDIKSV